MKRMFAACRARPRASVSISAEGSIATTSRASSAKLRASGTRAATKIEHAVMGAKAGGLGDAADQRRDVRHPAPLVVRRSRAVAFRVERCVRHRRISLAVGAAVPHIATVDIGGERRMISLARIAVAAAARCAERNGVALVHDVLLLGIGLLAVD